MDIFKNQYVLSFIISMIVVGIYYYMVDNDKTKNKDTKNTNYIICFVISFIVSLLIIMVCGGKSSKIEETKSIEGGGGSSCPF